MSKIKISDYLRAGYPCLFIRTVEPEFTEEVIRKEVQKVSALENCDFGVWKLTTGLMVGDVQKLETPRSQADDLLESIKKIMDAPEDRPIVGVFYNIRSYINQPAVIQRLSDAIFKIRTTGSHIIIIGPELQVPVELVNLITFYDMPLPSKSELEKDFLKIAEAYADEIKLPKKQKEKKLLIARAATAALGLDRIGAENAFTLSLSSQRKIDTLVIQSQKEDAVRKSDVLEFVHDTESIENVGGFDVYKRWLELRKGAFSLEAREYGLPYPKGVLICGVAGTGKSLVAKATAHFLGLPLILMDMGRIYRSFVGESEAAVRQALRVAEAVSPCVLWLDEIEKSFAGMNGGGVNDSGVTSRVLSTILTWRQETKYPVMFAATANDISALPSMLTRKGRFDEVWATDLPNFDARMDIFAIHLKKRKRNPKNFNLEMLAELTEQFTGAEIEGAVTDAMFLSYFDKVELSDKYIVKAIKETIPQAQRNPEELKAVRNWMVNRARLVSSKSTNKKRRGKKNSNTVRVLRK